MSSARQDRTSLEVTHAGSLGALTSRGVVTCTLLLVLLVGTAGVFGESIRQREVHGRLINLSGKQRMFSQRIALASSWVVSRPGDAKARASLEAAVSEMEASHAFLAGGEGNPTSLTPELEAHYFEGEGALDPMVRGYLARARRVLDGDVEAHGEIRAMADQELLGRLDRAVGLYERDGVEALQELALAFYVLLAVSFVVLVLVGLVVIRPLVREAASRMRDLEGATVALAESNMKLEERVEERTVELELALSQRTQLLKELHHRVKNNLQIVASLLRLQMARTENEAARGALLHTRSRIDALATLHRTLHDGGDVSSLDLGAYLGELVHAIIAGQTQGDAEVELEVESVMVSPDTATPCGLLVNELVTNAIKYGCSDDGRLRLTVSLEERGGEVTLTVADQGPGLGLEGAAGVNTSLGLQLVRNLSAQLEGELSFDAESGGCVRLRFPLPPRPEDMRDDQ